MTGSAIKFSFDVFGSSPNLELRFDGSKLRPNFEVKRVALFDNFKQSSITTDFSEKSYHTKSQQLASYSSHCLNLLATKRIDDDHASANRTKVIEPPGTSNRSFSNLASHLYHSHLSECGSSVEELTRINFPDAKFANAPSHCSVPVTKVSNYVESDESCSLTSSQKTGNNTNYALDPPKISRDSRSEAKNRKLKVRISRKQPDSISITPFGSCAENHTRSDPSDSLAPSASHHPHLPSSNDHSPKSKRTSFSLDPPQYSYSTATSSLFDLSARESMKSSVASVCNSKSVVNLTDRAREQELDFTSTESVNRWCDRIMSDLETWKGPPHSLTSSDRHDSLYAACSALKRVGDDFGVRATCAPSIIDPTTCAKSRYPSENDTMPQVATIPAANLLSADWRLGDCLEDISSNENSLEERHRFQHAVFTWPLADDQNSTPPLRPSAADFYDSDNDRFTFLASDCSWTEVPADSKEQHNIPQATQADEFVSSGNMMNQCLTLAITSKTNLAVCEDTKQSAAFYPENMFKRQNTESRKILRKEVRPIAELQHPAASRQSFSAMTDKVNESITKKRTENHRMVVKKLPTDHCAGFKVDSATCTTNFAERDIIRSDRKLGEDLAVVKQMSTAPPPNPSTTSTIRTVVAKIIKLAENEINSTKKICIDGLKLQKHGDSKRKPQGRQPTKFDQEQTNNAWRPEKNVGLVPEHLLRCKFNCKTDNTERDLVRDDWLVARDVSTQTSPLLRRFSMQRQRHASGSTTADEDCDYDGASSSMSSISALGDRLRDIGVDVGTADVKHTATTSLMTSETTPSGRCRGAPSTSLCRSPFTVATASTTTPRYWQSTSAKSLNLLLDNAQERTANHYDSEMEQDESVERKCSMSRSNGSNESSSSFIAVLPDTRSRIERSLKDSTAKCPAVGAHSSVQKNDVYGKISKLTAKNSTLPCFCGTAPEPAQNRNRIGNKCGEIIQMPRPSLNSPLADRRFISKFIKDNLGNQNIVRKTALGRKQCPVNDSNGKVTTEICNVCSSDSNRLAASTDDFSPSSQLTSLNCEDGGDSSAKVSDLGGIDSPSTSLFACDSSPVLADSESSPVRDEEISEFYDEKIPNDKNSAGLAARAAVLPPSDASNITQAAPEFQYKNPEDYERDRNLLTQINKHLSMPANSDDSESGIQRSCRKSSVYPKMDGPARGNKTNRYSLSSQQRNSIDGACVANVSYPVRQNYLETTRMGTFRLPTLPSVSPSLAGSLPTLHRSSLDAETYYPRDFSFENNVSQLKPGAEGYTYARISRNTVEDDHYARPVGLVTAEKTARQCCKWLRAAGFPQYAKMYEDKQFPVDLRSVRSDHEFLDVDSLQALFRRLHVLNECAKLDLVKAQHSKTPDDESDDDDAEDQLPISRHWKFVRKSRTFSRVVDDKVGDYHQFGQIADKSIQNYESQNDFVPPKIRLNPSRRPAAFAPIAKPSGESAFAICFVPRKVCFERPIEIEHQTPLDPPTKSPKLQRSHSERLKDKARALVQRMDNFRNSVRHKSPARADNRTSQSKKSLSNQLSPKMFDGDVNIGSPTLIDYSSYAVAEMHRLISATDADTKFYCCQEPSVEAALSAAANSRRHGLSEGPSSPPQQRSELEKIGTVAPSLAGFRSPETEKSHWSALNCTDLAFKDTPNCGADVSLAASVATSIEGCSTLYGPQKHGRSSFDQSYLASVTGGTQDSSLSRRHRVPIPSTSSDDNDGGYLYWERRDSGVGSSLSRSPSAPMKPRARWHSFQRQRMPGPTNKLHSVAASSSVSCINWLDQSSAIPLDRITLTQFISAQKYALLKLTALMEKYSPASKSSAGGWQFGVQKLLKKMKNNDKTLNDCSQIFGVSLTNVAQRTGQPLPQCILHSMRFLRRQAPDAVGIFRKSGVRSRITNIRNLFESCSELIDFDPQQTYDVADTVKQYFRELPEPLLTSKLSETFVAIFLTVPEHIRLEAVQRTILLLPDENREALQSVIYFLHDIASFSETNQMTAQNLAVCFAPTLFQLSSRNMAMSPQRRHKTITGGIPNEKELNENRAAQMCLTTMIQQALELFMVPKDIIIRCNLNLVEQHEDPSSLDELGLPYGNYVTYLNGCIDILLKEHREKWRGWVIEGSYDGVEMSSKKVNDGHPLKLWRLWTDVDAPPKEVLFRILKERESWDEDIVKWRTVRKISDSCDVFQYVSNDMPPHPTREYCVLRKWLIDMFEIKGGCILVETSVNVPEAPRMGGVRGACLASRYLIEPSGAGRSRVNHLVRVDTKGRSKAWYGKVFGHIWAGYIARMRNSFRQMSGGPETKV